MQYYQKAAYLGDSIAFYYIGCLYENGQGVKRDYSKALEYYQKAADLGNKEALERINPLKKRMKK